MSINQDTLLAQSPYGAKNVYLECTTAREVKRELRLINKQIDEYEQALDKLYGRKKQAIRRLEQINRRRGDDGATSSDTR